MYKSEESRDRALMVKSLRQKLDFLQVQVIKNIIEEAIKVITTADIKEAVSLFNDVMIKTDHYIVEKKF